jgi:mannose-6-phosphate isomerase-like protein (cupin superfamily)
MRQKILCLVGALALSGLVCTLSTAQPSDMMALDAIAADGLQYADLQPPGFAPGMKFAAVHGDLSVADQPYVLYRFPPHYHPNTENLTVLSGTFLLAMGKKADESQIKSYSAGDFLFMPARHPHYGGAKGETVIQLHGIGPFEVLLVEGSSK